ncbi:MAG: hypothetical protein WC915_03590 [archaeon]|jgi:hypothetical protein
MDKRIFALLIVLILSFSFLMAATMVFPTINSNTTPVESGQSIIYYLKVLNKQLVASSVSAELNDYSDEEREARANEAKQNMGSIKPPVVTDAIEKNTNQINTFTWKNLRQGSENHAAIFFPFVKSKLNDTNRQLGLSFTANSIKKEQWVWAYVNGKEIPCYSGWSSIINVAKYPLRFTWWETDESCTFPIDGIDVVSISIKDSGTGGYDLIIKSPLIPDSCNGKEQTQGVVSNSENALYLDKCSK